MFEYDFVYIFNSGKEGYKISALGDEFELDFLQDICNYYGSENWELINTTDLIGTELQNFSLIPLPFAFNQQENVRGVTETIISFLIFKRRIETPVQFSDEFNSWLANKADNEEKRLKNRELRESAELGRNNLQKVIEQCGEDFEPIEMIFLDLGYTYLQNYPTRKILQKGFEEIRFDLLDGKWLKK